MSRGLNVKVVRKSELNDESYHAGLNDPDGIAGPAEVTRRAFLSNPLSTGDDDPVQLLALVGDRIIGRMDLIPGRLLAAGRPCPVLWGSNLSVARDYRETGAGLILILRWQSMSPTVACCGVSHRLVEIYDRLQWLTFAMPRWVMLLRSRPLVQRYLRLGAPSVLAAAPVDAALRLYNGARWRAARGLTAGLTCREERALPADLDPALRMPGATLASHRSREWIEWLLSNSLVREEVNRRRLFLVHNLRGEVVAYFVVKERRHPVLSRHRFRDVRLGSLVDWFIFEPARVTVSQIIALAIREMRHFELDAIEICTTHGRAGVLASSLGLHQVGHLRFVLHASSASPLQRFDYTNRALWRITPAESDNAFF
jgi:hypothetical protein